MKKINKAKLGRFSLCSIVGMMTLAFSLSASAQWKWIDGNGVTKYSDAPPPASVPQDKILKRPEGSSMKTTTPALDTPEIDEQKLREEKEQKELDEKVKEQERKEKEAAEKKKKEQEKQMKESCKNARKSLKLFDEGQRIRQKNSKGEYEYLDDKGIKAKRKQTQDFINKHCR